MTTPESPPSAQRTAESPPSAQQTAESPPFAASLPAAVELRVPAQGTYVPMLRTLTAGLAARCELTIDEVEDLRIAVDEACSLLLPLVSSSPDAALVARFSLASGRLDVEAAVPAPPEAQPDRDGFAWTVLGALADEVEVRSENGRLAIGLTKRRAEPPR